MNGCGCGGCGGLAGFGASAPPVTAPAPAIGIFDAFGSQYRPFVIAGSVTLGALVLMKLIKP